MKTNLFISYSNHDEVSKDSLIRHLATLERQDEITIWHYRDIQAGDRFGSEISRMISFSDIFLLLVSPNFLHSQYCYFTELRAALARKKWDGAQVIPIILDHCDWKNIPALKDLSALPKDGKPLSEFGNQNEQFLEITNSIRNLCKTLPHQTELTVSSDGYAAYETISEAIAVADANSRISILPGIYEETLYIDKPLAIFGEVKNSTDEVIIRSGQEAVITCNTNKLILSNLKIEQINDTNEDTSAIHIESGYSLILNCSVSSAGSIGLVSEANSSCDVFSSYITAPKGIGVAFLESKQILVENCIIGPAQVGALIQEARKVELSRNVFENQVRGIVIDDKSAAQISNNHIKFSGIGILFNMSQVYSEEITKFLEDNKFDGLVKYAFDNPE